MRRDLLQSLRSLALIAAMFGAGYWAYARMGWGIRASPPGVVSIVVSFVVSMLLFDTWFYWLHRLIHSRWLFRTVHLWHHRTTAPEVWSNNSDLLLDTLFLQSYWLAAHFLIPIARPYLRSTSSTTRSPGRWGIAATSMPANSRGLPRRS